jgi:hypothetical protein
MIDYDTFDMAIKALEQDPCDNCKYLDGDGCRLVFEFEQFGKASDECPNDNNVSTTVSRGVFEQVRWERDIAISQLKKLGYGFGEKIEPCEDVISRQAVLDGLASIAKAKAKSDAQKSLIGRVMFFVEQLPSVNPTKTGHREYNDIYDHYLCGNCKTVVMDYDNYCPNCGARMVGEQNE